MGGGSVSVEKLNPGQPNQRVFLSMFKSTPTHTISENAFVEHVVAALKRLPASKQDAILGVDWWPQAEHHGVPDPDNDQESGSQS